MKKRTLFQFVSSRNKSLLRYFLPLIVLLLSVNGLMAQQVIGSFPAMDGGFEAGASSGAITSVTIASGAQSSVWSTSSSSLGTFLTTSPRTGLKYVNFIGGSSKRLQSPTFVATLLTAQQYTVQYYYRTTNSTATGPCMQVGASTDGTSTPTYNPATASAYSLLGTSNVWTKHSYNVTLTAGGAAGKYGIGIIRTTIAPVVTLDIDDVVMYAGALDETAPDPVTSPTIPAAAATQQTISWTAPGTGVDGGGYMVVRGLSDPTTAPNVNGIYQVGNTVATGQQVVYIGTSTSFPDLGLTPSTHYYYRIYTVDKAFNYSSFAAIDGTTTAPNYAAEPTAQVTGLNFSSVSSTGFTINFTPAVSGSGTNHLVILKAASDITADPVDGSSYTADPAFATGSAVGGGKVVYNGTSNSVAVTGLSKAILYYVRIYDFNGSGGSENYLITTPASGNQLASPGEIVSKGTNGAGASYSTGSAWVGEVAPGRYDNVTIVSPDVFNVGSTQACYNLTIQSGAKLWATSQQYFDVYGTSLICNGTLGDPSNTASLLYLEFGGNLNISGSGSIYPWKLRPITGLTNIGITFDANVSLTMTGTTMIFDNIGNDNIYYTVNSPRTLSIANNFNTCSASATQSTSNNTLTINQGATVNVAGVLYTNELAGKTYTANINGTLAVTGTSTLSGTTGGGVATFNVNGAYSTGSLLVTPSTAAVAPVIKVGSTGTITVNGTADFSNTSLSGFIGNAPSTTGGTFTLGSTGSMSIAAPTGLEPVAGPIRTSTRNFNAAAGYSFVGTAAQASGSDLPSTIGSLTLNNAAGLTLNAATTVTGALTLTNGKLSLGANNLTVGSTSGASTTNYVVTDGVGKLTQPVTAAGTVVFPIGASVTSYDPVSVTPVSATNFSARVSSILSGTAPASYNYTAKEWNLSSDAPSSTIVALTPFAVTASGVYPNIGQYNGTAYVNTPATLAGSTYSATFTTFGPFVTGYGDLGTGINPVAINGVSFDGQIIHNNANIDLQVFDATGRMMVSSNKNIDMTSYSKGIYVVKSNAGTLKISLKK